MNVVDFACLCTAVLKGSVDFLRLRGRVCIYSLADRRHALISSAFGRMFLFEHSVTVAHVCEFPVGAFRFKFT